MNDAISRSALLKTANAEEKLIGKDWDYDALKTAIELAPSLDVIQVVHAKWDDNHCCTNCKHEALLEYECDGCDEGFAWKHSSYCPYCGAIMDIDKMNI